MMGVPMTWLLKADRIGKTITAGFIRADGSPVENVVYSFGEGSMGEARFYELMGKADDAKVDGKEKYKRLFIQEVRPVILPPSRTRYQKTTFDAEGEENGSQV